MNEKKVCFDGNSIFFESVPHRLGGATGLRCTNVCDQITQWEVSAVGASTKYMVTDYPPK
jgi:hypothetical protein